MEELMNAASATALDDPHRRPRPNQLFQGVLAFLAVVGIGAAATVILRPPVRLRVITVEKHVPAAVAQIPERMRPVPERPVVIAAPPVRTKRAAVPPPAKALPRTLSTECNDPLCGIDLKE